MTPMVEKEDWAELIQMLGMVEQGRVLHRR